MNPTTVIRPARDEDGDAIIALLRAVFVEYDCVFELDEFPELPALASHIAHANGRAWVAEHEGRVVGSVAFTPSSSPGGVELRKLYLARDLRGSGLGEELCARVEDDARARGLSFVDLWTDTRFTRAHRFYERRGYVKGPVTRDLHDKSRSTEYYYRLVL